MLKLIQLYAIIFIIPCCNNISKKDTATGIKAEIKKPATLAEIPLPKGFQRVQTNSNGFEFYLQHFKLNANNTVYYWDGAEKSNQSSHYAVLDISIGKKDLQQCADAIMRLRAEYFFARKEYDKIEFKNGTTIFNFGALLKHSEIENIDKAFTNFLENVFANCGTYNLADMLHTKQNFNDIAIGDVLVKGGSPGHAMIVVDVAANNLTKEKIYLLAQGFMPAQSVHIVINPNDEKLSPWYKADVNNPIITPGYIFSPKSLKEW